METFLKACLYCITFDAILIAFACLFFGWHRYLNSNLNQAISESETPISPNTEQKVRKIFISFVLALLLLCPPITLVAFLISLKHAVRPNEEADDESSSGNHP
jgi:ABC-type Fe3+ transport system permease subunit